ncbi:MAG: hypothetical protein IPL50_14070 [Chitinophagaceae bacterium]|nr:hypothetical protein [Chitinophagaceae bacterium]
MKKYNALYYLLFILLVMGAFAAMAQNGYGMTIMGGVSVVFALVFLAEFITVLRKEGPVHVYRLAEAACLFVIAAIFGLRVFYIHFPYVEWLFGIAALLLALLYLRKMISRYRYFSEKNRSMALLVLLFHSSIILFLVSLFLVPVAAWSSELCGIAAFVLLVVFLSVALLKKELPVEGENMSAFGMVRGLKDHSVIIISLFVLFSLYVASTASACCRVFIQMNFHVPILNWWIKPHPAKKKSWMDATGTKTSRKVMTASWSTSNSGMQKSKQDLKV